MRAILLVVIFAVGANAAKLGRLIRATPSNQEQLNFLKQEADNDNLDFWTHPSEVGNPVDIRVAHELYDELAQALHSKGVVFTIQIPDLDGMSSRQNPPSNMRAGGFAYTQYNKLNDINAEIDRIVRTRPDVAQKFSVGNSYEKRPMYAVKLSSGAGKKTLFMNCGIHAREWITPATCMYMLNQIVTKYGSDASINAMLNKLDIVIMPVLNVDGYSFTWNGNRMWRKTRSRNVGSSCIGTDPNRNWNVKWGGVGTSSSPCRDTYHGPYPFSEIETRNVARYLYDIRSSIVGYMDIHAYSQLWMTPWGHAKGAYPKDYSEMKRVADKAIASLYNAGYRTSYRAGTSADIIYATTGGTSDWATAALGVTYSYALELRDKGRYGFMLPANQIIPTGIETLAAIKTMVAEMRI